MVLNKLLTPSLLTFCISAAGCEMRIYAGAALLSAASVSGTKSVTWECLTTRSDRPALLQERG